MKYIASKLKVLWHFSVLTLLATVSYSSHADGSVPAYLYIHNAISNKTDRLNVRFYSEDNSRIIYLKNEKGEDACKGTITFRGHDVVFKDFECFSGSLKISEIFLKEVPYKNGVMLHLISMTQVNKESLIGILVHLRSYDGGGDRQGVIPDEKILELYGEFPNWRMPQ